MACDVSPVAMFYNSFWNQKDINSILMTFTADNITNNNNNNEKNNNNDTIQM